VLALLAMARQRGVKLSALTDTLPQRHTASDRLQDFPTDISRDLLKQLQTDGSAYQEIWGDQSVTIVQRDNTDGLRLTLATGDIVHVRPSGNAPELRCYAEADTVERAQTWVDLTLHRLKQRLVS